jgi:hypothetical protein
LCNCYKRDNPLRMCATTCYVIGISRFDQHSHWRLHYANGKVFTIGSLRGGSQPGVRRLGRVRA